jgi:hypothetical protein
MQAAQPTIPSLGQSLREYHAGAAGGTLAAADLGTLLVLEVREALSVPAPALKDAWARGGLPEALCPRGRHPRDAFRAATPRRLVAAGLSLYPYTSAPALKKAGLEMAVVVTRTGDAKTAVSKLHRNRAMVGLTAAGELEVRYRPTARRRPTRRPCWARIAADFARHKEQVDGAKASAA